MPLAQAQTPLTLEEVERLYLARNPELLSFKDRIEVAQGEYRQAGLHPNPHLSYSEEGLPVGADNVDFFRDQEFIVWGTQRLELGGKRGWRKKVASTGVEIAKAELEDFVRLGKARVRQAYLLAADSQERVGFAQQQLDSYYQIREVHRKRLEAGDVSGLSQMRIDLEELRFLTSLSRSKADFNAAWTRLAALIGWTEPGPARLRWSARENAPNLSLDRLKELALERRPDLTSLSLAERRAQEAVDLEKAKRIPDLTVGGGYKSDFGVHSFYASATLPLPLFDRNQGAIQQAAAELRRTRNQLLWKKLEIGAEVERHYRNHEETRDAVARVGRGLLERAEKVLESTRVSYSGGESSLTDYLDALRVRLDATLAFYDLRLQLERSRILLDQAVGVETK